MFYRDIELPQSEMERSFKLIENFLQKLPEVLKELENETEKDGSEKSDFFDLNSISDYYKTIFNDSFEDIFSVRRQLRIEIITNPEKLFRQLEQVGLVGEIATAKFKLLDWWYYKVRDYTKSDKLNGAIEPLIDLLKSILKSICSGLGYKWSDVFDEGFDLIKALRKAIEISLGK